MSGINNGNPPTTDAGTPSTPADRSAFNVVNNRSAAAPQIPPASGMVFTPIGTTGGGVSFANPTAITMPPPPQLPPYNPNAAATTAAVAAADASATTWQCVCGNVCLASKARCGQCNKWRGGKRKPYKKKKNNNNNSNNTTTEAAHTPNLPSSVNVLPAGGSGGTRLSGISPMTVGFDDGSSIRSVCSSVASVVETNEMIREMAMADYRNNGDGGDSDEEGEGGFEVVESMLECTSARERATNDHQEIEANVSDAMENCTYANVADATTGNSDTAPAALKGAPEGWIPPQPDSRFNPDTQTLGPGEPPFSTVDNPGNWSQYTFRPKFEGKGASRQYKSHEMPAGATPVPLNNEGKRICEDGWEYFYTPWKHPKNDPSFYREGATRDDFFPADRSCQLDGALLKKMGLNEKRMQDGDALFFLQLLTPFCDPKLSGIDGDPRKGFYCDVSDFTSSYAFGKKKSSGNYSNKFEAPTAEELVNWDGVVIENKNDFIGDSWITDTIGDTMYNPLIADTMYFRRWVDIKRNLKLCDWTKETTRDNPNYDPTQKYRLIWDVTTYNLNQFIKKGGKDVVVDETTWANMSYADVQSVVKGKPGVSKGGQHTVLVDRERRYIYAWVPRHKWVKRAHPFTQQGPAELKLLLDQCLPLVQGEEQEPGDTRRQIFEEKFHVTADNHFSGKILDYMGERGWKGTMTTRRDRLPVNKKYLHHKKETPINQVSKVARYENPVILVKHSTPPEGSELKPYTRTHCSFQSTGSCNISMVNACQEIGLYVRPKERGRGNDKRIWGIEDNEARDLYLFSYSAVDKIDQMLQNWNEFYISWKWWHAPTRHGKSLAKCMAYEMYKECASGQVDPAWKVDKPKSAKAFRRTLAKQMCNYRARNTFYPGDDKLRNTTKLPKKRRGMKQSNVNASINDEDHVGVSYAQFLDAKRPRGRTEVSRLCGDNFGNLGLHMASIKTVQSRKICEVCGKPCWKVCGVCNMPMHSGIDASNSCWLTYHDDNFFGLTRGDNVKLLQGKKSEWKPPTAATIDANTRHIAKLKKRMANDISEEED